MLVNLLLWAVGTHGCPDVRTHALDRLFDEVKRLTGGEEVTLEMMRRYEDNVPRVQHWLITHVIGDRGINYILHRCEGDDGKITRVSAQRRTATCISTCTYAHALNKFLDWGYTKYWIE